jgi:hypothetical protein
MFFSKKILFGATTLMWATTSTLSFAGFGEDEGIDFTNLEQSMPVHFRGFSSTDFDLANKLRHMGWYQPANELRPLLQEWGQRLEGHEKHAGVKAQIDDALQKSEAPTRVYAAYLLFSMVLDGAKFSDREHQFFSSVGLSKPYEFVKAYEGKGLTRFSDFIGFLEKHVSPVLSSFGFEDHGYSEDVRDFEYIPTQYYPDNQYLISEHIVPQGSYASVTYPLVDENVLGFFYLAWTYAKGIHPVPFPLVEDDAELHGINMSTWSEVCHDLGHHQVDAKDFSAEQFAHNLINYYLLTSAEELRDLPLPQRGQYGVKSMIPHFGEFAVSVHSAYRKALVEILKKSVRELEGANEEQIKDWEAFSVAAFVHSHEEPEVLDMDYGTTNLTELLKASQSGQEKKVSVGTVRVAADDDQFATSFVTGESPLTDDEIFDIVKSQPKSRFLRPELRGWSGAEDAISEEYVAEYHVDRTLFAIEVTVIMLNGEELVYREVTNYSKQLNFDHDLSMLKAAEVSLLQDYGYELPSIPKTGDFLDEGNVDEQTYHLAAEECLEQLRLGRSHLRDIYLKNAVRLSEQVGDYDSELSIAEQFAVSVTNAMTKLQNNLPPFIGSVGDFISGATTLTEQNTED